MFFLLSSIACSVAVAVLLKLARQHDLDLRQTIAFNYLITTALTMVLLRPELASLKHTGMPLLMLVALGLLLPLVFMAMANAVREAGIVRSDAAQRLSLIIPLLAAFTVFGQDLLPLKLAGIALGLLALACLLNKPAERSAGQGAWRWLLAVWLGYGLIDLLFKRLALAGAGFAPALLVAFVLAGLAMLGYLLVRGPRWQPLALVLGLPLGLLNFGNILFYIRAHQQFATDPALVFAAMNIGVISLGTVVGAVLFREVLRPLHYVGLLLAVLAVLCLMP